MKLRVGNQPGIEQLSIRHAKLRQRFLENSIVPESGLDGFVLGQAVFRRDSGRKNGLSRLFLMTDCRSVTGRQITRDSVPSVPQRGGMTPGKDHRDQSGGEQTGRCTGR